MKWRCRENDCKFRTDSHMELIHHSIVEHGRQYKIEYVMEVHCRDKSLKDKVIELIGASK